MNPGKKDPPQRNRQDIGLIVPQVPESFTSDAKNEALGYNRYLSRTNAQMKSKRTQALAGAGQETITGAATAVLESMENADVLTFVKRMARSISGSVGRTMSALMSHRTFKKSMGEELGEQVAHSVLNKSNVEEESGPAATADMTNGRPRT